MSKSAINLPLVHFNKGLSSVCGVNQVPNDVLKQQGCCGNTAKSWSVYPFCEACAVRGFETTSVRQTNCAKSKRSARAKKRALHQLHEVDTTEVALTVNETQLRH
jgi:hypothetical protein